MENIMKVQRLKIGFIIMLLLSHVVVFAAKDDNKGKDSKKGWRESYGGDSTIADFKSNALYMADTIGADDFKAITNQEITYFKQAVINSDIECRQNLVLDGVTKDAINFPNQSPQKILLNCDKYNSLVIPSKQLLSMHEYLPLIGIDDSTYQFSQKLFYQFQVKSTVPNPFNEELHNAGFYCHIPQMKEALNNGASPYYRNNNGLGKNVFEGSITSNCHEAIVYLLNQEVGIVVNYRDIYNSMIDALIYSVIPEYKVHRLEEQESFIKTLQLLLKRYPDLKNFETKLNKNIDIRRYAHYYYALTPEHHKCFDRSTILHFTGFFYYEALAEYKSRSREINRNLWLKKSELLNDLYNELLKLGFDENAKNVCGQTPKMIKEGVN
jgi:hypothetical protein